MKIADWVQEGGCSCDKKITPFFLNKVDFEIPLRKKEYSVSKDIWLPQSSKKSIASNFSKRHRYSPRGVHRG